MAFRPGNPSVSYKNDLPVTSTSANMAFHSALRVNRFNANGDDIYLKFGVDNTVVAVLGEGIRLPDGQTELIEAQLGHNFFAYVSANPSKLNVVFGENE